MMLIVPFNDNKRLAFGMDQENLREPYCVMSAREDEPTLARANETSIYIWL